MEQGICRLQAAACNALAMLWFSIGTQVGRSKFCPQDVAALHSHISGDFSCKTFTAGSIIVVRGAQSPEELRRSLEELQTAVAAEREAAAAAERRNRELAARLESITKVLCPPVRLAAWQPCVQN